MPGTVPPPAWPEKGTAAYEARLAQMRAGWAKKRQQAAQAKREAKKAAPPVAEAELIDTGQPEAVRMAPEEREEPRTKAGSKGKTKSGEFDEPTLREYLSLAVNGLATLQGHEHWGRSDEELAYVTVPGTRCLNRLDKRARERLQAMSDPAALVFGVVMIFGPSVLKEVERVQKSTGVSRRQPQPTASNYAAAQAEAAAGIDGVGIPGPRAVSTNGTAVPATVADLHATGY